MRRNFIFLALLFIVCYAFSLPSLAQGNQEELALQAFIKAENMRRTKRYIEALFEYDKAIVGDPKNFKFVFSKGQCYFMLRDADNTISTLKKTVEIKKDFIPAYTLMAQCYKAQKKYEDLVKALDNAFQYETDVQKKLKYKLTILNTLVRNGEYAKAKLHLADAKKLSSSDPDILFYEAKSSNELGDYASAKQAMLTATRQLTSKEPKYVSRFYYELGYSLYKLGSYDLAFEAWQNANYGYYKNLIGKFDPKNYYSTAQAYYKVYEYGQAKEYLQLTLKMQHNFAQAHILMAEISKKENNRHDEALVHYLEAVKNEQNSNTLYEMYKNITQGEMDAGKFGDAITYAKEALKIKPTDYNMMFLQAMAYYRLKNYQESVHILESITIIAGLDFESRAMYYFALATVRKAMGQIDKAKDAFKKADYGTFSRAAQMEWDKISPKKPEEEKSQVEEQFDIGKEAETSNTGG
jgi:tetratricopeptide (TPR) repeat protein